jgi:hypothetical protein
MPAVPVEASTDILIVFDFASYNLPLSLELQQYMTNSSHFILLSNSFLDFSTSLSPSPSKSSMSVKVFLFFNCNNNNENNHAIKHLLIPILHACC